MLDHIIILVASLFDFQKDFSEQHGIELTQGGAHPDLGTANLLADLGGGCYLEVLGLDPDLAEPTAVGEMLSRCEEPQVAWFALRTDSLQDLQSDIELAELKFLGPSDGSRETADGELLDWSGAYVAGHDFGGQVPFFIDWRNTPHPSETSAKGLELLEFSVLHPEAEALTDLYSAIQSDVAVESSERVGFRLRIKSPRGEMTLESYPTQSLFTALMDQAGVAD